VPVCTGKSNPDPDFGIQNYKESGSHKYEKIYFRSGRVCITCLHGRGVTAETAPGKYIGVQYAIGDYSEDGIPEDFSPTALVGRFGANVNPNFAVEARLGFGLQDDTQSIFGFDASLELDSLVGIYGVGSVNLGGMSSLYGVIGFTRIEGTASIPAIPGASSTDDETDLSIGIGGNIGVSKTVALNIEYISYVSKSTFDLNALGLGIVVGF